MLIPILMLVPLNYGTKFLFWWAEQNWGRRFLALGRRRRLSFEGFPDVYDSSDEDEYAVDSPADKLDFEQYARRRLAELHNSWERRSRSEGVQMLPHLF
jgi:hypothetical protein